MECTLKAEEGQLANSSCLLEDPDYLADTAGVIASSLVVVYLHEWCTLFYGGESAILDWTVLCMRATGYSPVLCTPKLIDLSLVQQYTVMPYSYKDVS